MKVQCPGKLQGKVVLITGAARRIGRGLALGMAAEGAKIAITYNTSEREAEHTIARLAELGTDAIAVRCDVRDEQNVEEMVRAVVAELGALHVLVNNAGIFETTKFDAITSAQWDDMFAVNTRGPFMVSRAALVHLRRSRGRIINIGSLGGLHPWTTHGHYCASKAALIMLTQIMAKALAPRVAVNCVAPGMISSGEGREPAYVRSIVRKTPMKRAGSVQDVLDAVLFFAAASHFITGQTLVVDGGLGL
jgi:NAD(P)-dependent dehydrogenase (short-subunit alcohol dehydrogenase family)